MPVASHIEHFLLNQTFMLLPQKALIWKEQNMLIAADVHLGKTAHFRKAGIAVPGSVSFADLDMLDRLIDKHEIRHLLVLGDLFHTHRNAEWNYFTGWRVRHEHTRIDLVKGNHDLVPDRLLKDAGLICHEKSVQYGPFLFSHKPFSEEDLKSIPQYVMAGHVHPGIRLSGKAKQHLDLCCFYFGQKQAILPAFGTFTGKFLLNVQKHDHIYAVFKDKVMPVQ